MLVEVVAQGNPRRTSLSRQATGEAMFGGGIRGSCERQGKGSGNVCNGDCQSIPCILDRGSSWAWWWTLNSVHRNPSKPRGRRLIYESMREITNGSVGVI